MLNRNAEETRLGTARTLIAAVLGIALCGTTATRAEHPHTDQSALNRDTEPVCLLVTRQEDMCVVKRHDDKKMLYRNRDARLAIEWALRHSPIAVLGYGRFTVTDGVKIPRPGVALIVAKDATLQVAHGAKLTAVSEGHGEYCPLIHNQGMDNVAVINFGILLAGGRHGACIMFNGRSKGDLGIDGGLVFSTGTLTNCNDAIWLVDSKNLQVPFVGDTSYGNAPLAIEGCEDLKIDIVAGLAGSKARENETIDLNSYSRRVTIHRLIGTSRSEQVLDVNNSTEVTVDEIVGYSGEDEFRGKLLSIIHYGPHGRRLTQRPRIPKSENVEIRSQRVSETKVSQWKIDVDVDGLPESLPVLQVAVRAIGNPDTNPVTIVERTYRLELDGTPTAAVLDDK